MTRVPNRDTRPAGGFRIGFVPLVDAAPLLVAEALGLYERRGIKVRLSPELGWGSIREKIVYGELEAAHAPGALLFSILLGTHARACAVGTDLMLNLQGNAITLSRRWWQKGTRDTRTFRAAVRSEAPRVPVFAVVSRFSSHLFLLRNWLRSAGLDPDRDARYIVLPPPLVGEHLRGGQIDGFCAGEPWNSLAALQGDGWVVATSGTLAPRHPEKVLLVRNELLDRRDEGYDALRAAVVDACRFCDKPESRDTVVDILHARGVFPKDRAVLANSLIGPFQTGTGALSEPGPFTIFHRGQANAATRERAEWCLDAAIECDALVLDARSRRFCLDAFIDPHTEGPKPRRTTAATQPA